jgi:hypothetical protein
VAELTSEERGSTGSRSEDPADLWPVDAPPWRGKRAALIAAILVVVALLVGIPLFALVPTREPNVPMAGPELTVISQFVNLTPPPCPEQSGAYQTITVVNVTFTLQLGDWCTSHPQVSGTGTDGGTTAGFLVGVPGSPVNASGWAVWSSPDGQFGVRYDLHVTVELWADAWVYPP